MKRILKGFIVLLFAAGTARAEFEGVADMKIASSGGPAGEAVSGSGRVYISKTGWRYEVEMSNPEVAKMTGGKPFRMCMLGKIGSPDIVYSVNDAMKTYSVVNTKEMRGLAARARGGEEKFDVQKLGKDTVAGLPCQNVRISSTSRKTAIEACISKEFVSGDWLRAMQGDQGGDWLKALKNAGVEGYPLRLTMTTKGQPGGRTTMEITKLDRKAVPASMFEIPPGYEQKSMMENMAQSPEQARQMEDARKQLQREMEKMTPEQRKMMEEMLKKQPPPKQ